MSAFSRYGRSQVARAFGATLRAARLQRGVSQDRLGVLCGFDRTYPSLMERGKRHPSLHMLLRLADALDSTPEQLVTDTVKRLRGEAQS
jgi:transcriptional regulator with XRE-family HTH domain